MNVPEIKSYEEQAVDTVVSVINRAKELLGIRQTLKELAKSRDFLSPRGKIGSITLKCPLIKNSEILIKQAIERDWRLIETLLYTLNYTGESQDETSKYYYFEAVFSQPTAAYPIPQETASVYFRVQDKLIEPPETRGVPVMTFRIEGHYRDYDVRFIRLTADWILGVLKMKSKLFKRIEEINLF